MERPVLLLCLLVMAGCGAGDESTGTLKVVATTPVVGDIARNVAGPAADVRILIPPDADPHDYELRPHDATAIAEADVIVRSGGDLDDWLEEAIEGTGGDAPVLDLMAKVERIDDDPHWWHAPRNGRIAAHEIAALLGRAAGGSADGFRRNAEAYRGRLGDLEAAIARCVATVPENARKLVTTHDALGYFARRFGFEVVGTVIPSLSTQGQPSSGDVARLSRDVREAGVRTIFPEASVSAKVEGAIAREAGVEVGPELQADTLAEGITYVEALSHNARAIVSGLGGRCEL